jgi:integrase/recombinase XerD
MYFRQETEITRQSVSGYLGRMIQEGAAPNTVRGRLAALRAYTRWLVEDGEIAQDPLLGIKPPKIPTKITQGLSDEQLQALLKACKGQGFRDRRDDALIRFMVETGVRSQECLDLAVGDIEPLRNGVAVIHKGKGAKGRTVAFGPQTAASLDRYMRLRKLHKHRDLPNLWLGERGPLRYHGLNQTLRDRAETAGVQGFHLHLLRHSFATRWLRAQGSEQGLMTMAGWSSRSMLDRYTTASAGERAAEEARRLNLGDL